MKDWRDLTPDEKRAALSGRSSGENERIRKQNFQSVLNSLDANTRPYRIAWSMPGGNYLINTPEEIIDFCNNH